MEKKVKLSPRTRVKLKAEEMVLLKNYIENDPVSYANISHNTGIKRNTILRILDRGSMQLPVAIKLRDFLKLVQKGLLQ